MKELNEKYTNTENFGKWFKHLERIGKKDQRPKWKRLLPMNVPQQDFILKNVDTRDMLYVKFNLERGYTKGDNSNYLDYKDVVKSSLNLCQICKKQPCTYKCEKQQPACPSAFINSRCQEAIEHIQTCLG